MNTRLQQWLANQKVTSRFHPSWILMVVGASLAIGLLMWLLSTAVFRHESPSSAGPALPASAQRLPASEQQPSAAANQPAPPAAKITRAGFTPPDADAIPDTEFGDAVRLGRAIFTDTQTYAKAYVGNGLNCVNCHLDAGRKADSAPLWAAYGLFPMFRDKNQKVNTYEDRLAGCFRFSMNGRAPAYGSKEFVALMSYSYWLASGAPLGAELAGRGYPKLPPPQQAPDLARGKQVFDTQCAICHGADGQGTRVGARYAFPPLWGPHSFNAGAGMTQIKNAAGFIKANMPLGQGNTLSDQQAWDVAKYMTSQPRPADPRLGRS